MIFYRNLKAQKDSVQHITKILLVEDEEAVAKIHAKILEKAGFSVNVASSGEQAMKIADDNCLVLMDINLGNAHYDGIDVMTKINGLKNTKNVPVIYVTGEEFDDRYIERAGATNYKGYLKKPLALADVRITIDSVIKEVNYKYNIEQEVVKRTQDLSDVNEQLAKMIISLRESNNLNLYTISVITEMHESYTVGHQKRVADLARAIADDLKLDESIKDNIRKGAPLHDAGKIGVPVFYLNKTSKLEPEEFDLIKSHTGIGFRLFKNIDESVAKIALYHHERMDGSGYYGLKGDEITIEARVIAVADVVEAMSAPRPYRTRGLGIDEALAEIERNYNPKTGEQIYDPAVVAACLRLFREKGYSFPEITYGS